MKKATYNGRRKICKILSHNKEIQLKRDKNFDLFIPLNENEIALIGRR